MGDTPDQTADQAAATDAFRNQTAPSVDNEALAERANAMQQAVEDNAKADD